MARGCHGRISFFVDANITELKTIRTIYWHVWAQIPSWNLRRCKIQWKRYARYKKRNVVSHDSAVRLKALVPKAGAKLHEKCLRLFQLETNLSHVRLRSKLPVSGAGSNEDTFDDRDEDGMFVLKVLSSSRIDTAFTSRSFKEYIFIPVWDPSMVAAYYRAYRSIILLMASIKTLFSMWWTTATKKKRETMHCLWKISHRLSQ